MSSFKKNITQTLKTVIFAVILIAGVNYAFAIDWTPPTENPRGGNTPAPINVSSGGQTKSGGLWLNSSQAFSTSQTSDYGLVVSTLAGPYGFAVQGNGNVGIGLTLNEQATSRLDIGGQLRLRGGSPGLGKVLTSDANGLGSWQTPASGGGITGGTINKIPKFLSATTLTNSGVTEDSSGNVGIGTANPGAKLDVNGTVKISGGSPASGSVLTSSDSSGNATWKKGVEIGHATNNGATAMVCGLTPGKGFIATVSGVLTHPSIVSPFYTTVWINGIAVLVGTLPGVSFSTTFAVSSGVGGANNGCIDSRIDSPNGWLSLVYILAVVG